MAAFGIIGNAVEHRFGVRSFSSRQQVAEVQVAEHLSGLWRDAHDTIGMPDVGIHLATNILQLIQVIDRAAVFGNIDAAYLLKGSRIEKAKRRASVAEYEGVSILRQTPTLAIEMKSPEEPKAELVVDEADMGSPGKLNQMTLPIRESFGEIPGGKINSLQNGAGL